MMLCVVCRVCASWHVVNQFLISSHGMWLICCCRSFSLSATVALRCSLFPSLPFLLSIRSIRSTQPTRSTMRIRLLKSISGRSGLPCARVCQWVSESAVAATVAESIIVWCSAMPRPSYMPSHHVVTRQSVSVLISHWLNLLPTQLIHDTWCVMCHVWCMMYDVRLLLCDTPSTINWINWQALHITTVTMSFHPLYCTIWMLNIKSSFTIRSSPSNTAGELRRRKGGRQGWRKSREKAEWLASP